MENGCPPPGGSLRMHRAGYQLTPFTRRVARRFAFQGQYELPALTNAIADKSWLAISLSWFGSNSLIFASP